MSPLRITVFSDFSCPASYVTETALRALLDETFEIRYRAFELFPDSATPASPRFTDDEWSGLQELAAAAGITIAPRATISNTRKAHEASAFAREVSAEDRIREEIFAAFWSKGSDIGRVDVLSELGGRVGLDPEDLRIAMDIDRFREDVLADEDLARRLRIPGTPVLFLGTGSDARVVSGARGIEELQSLIQLSTRDRKDQTENV